MSKIEDIRFSVVVPAYNAAGTIMSSLRSVVNQSVPAFEIIVVNDGSTDETEKVVRENFGTLVNLISLEKNQGPAHARNIGLGKASGTHIAFQDADDIWHADKLRVISGILSSHPETAFVYHPYTLGAMNFEVQRYDMALSRYPFSKLLLSNPIGTPCVVMKRSDAIHFDESMHYMERLRSLFNAKATNMVFSSSIFL